MHPPGTLKKNTDKLYVYKEFYWNSRVRMSAIGAVR